MHWGSREAAGTRTLRGQYGACRHRLVTVALQGRQHAAGRRHKRLRACSGWPPEGSIDVICGRWSRCCRHRHVGCRGVEGVGALSLLLSRRAFERPLFCAASNMRGGRFVKAVRDDASIGLCGLWAVSKIGHSASQELSVAGGRGQSRLGVAEPLAGGLGPITRGVGTAAAQLAIESNAQGRPLQ